MALLEGEQRYERFGEPACPPWCPGPIWRCALPSWGHLPREVPSGRRALHIAEAVQHPVSLAGGLTSVGLLYLRQGDLHQAFPVLERA